MAKKPISKLERKIVNIGLTTILSAYALLSGNAYLVPRTTPAVITNVTSSEYEGEKVNIIETNRGKFRNEDSTLYGKHNSRELQTMAKKLIGKEVKIKNYGYGRLEFTEHPQRNVLDIEK